MDYGELVAKLQESWKPTSKKVVIIPGIELEFESANALDMLNVGNARDEKGMMIQSLMLAKIEPRMTYENAANLLAVIPGSEFDRLFKEIADALDTKGGMTIEQKAAFLEETPMPDQSLTLDSPSTNGLASPSEEPEKILSGSRRRSP